MKRFLLILSLMVAGFTVTFAQPTRPAPVDKGDFISKINNLNTLLTKGKVPDAKTQYNELDLLMGTNFRCGKYKIKDALDINDTANATKVQTNLKKQRGIYNDVSTLEAADIVGNQAKIYSKLNDFAALMD